MVNLNLKVAVKHKYDAIVVGSGISGGWAAKELTEKGLKTLLIERGREVKHIEDYPTATLFPWEMKHRGQLPQQVIDENPVVSKCYAFNETSAHFFVKDNEHPYVQEKPFSWIRAYQTGGKSLLWARQVQRWSPFDFEGPARDGYAVEWPIGYEDLAPWYSHVEKFAGISGNKDGLPHLPDGEFLPAFPLNCVEKYFSEFVAQQYRDRQVIVARCAHITEAQPIHIAQGRAKCQHRTLCERGCPLGGYFSSNASTIPWAMKTGNLTLLSDALVAEVLFDEKKNKASGVRVINTLTGESTEYFAKIIFVNGAALNSNLILLNSTSNRFPNGLGNDNGLMGKYVAFHNYKSGINAEYEGHLDVKTDGRRPTSGYIPRFRNLHKQEMDFLRGYATSFSASRSSYTDTNEFGESLKNALANPKLNGHWNIGAGMMGETIPKITNFVTLDEKLKDLHGMPQLKISVSYDDNDEKMTLDFIEQFSEMFTKAGFTNLKIRNVNHPPGLDIHEMGGIRMGKDPKTSLLNKWNQLHACQNVFVTDGACMTSTSTQNPSLTYMALSARAANYAVEALKKNII
jgi:choline dehydrogenase-like flavoprotein